jgi:Helix-turn-helix domain
MGTKGGSITELCALYGVSRKTGYKWIDRYPGRSTACDILRRHGMVPLRRQHRRMRIEDAYG